MPTATDLVTDLPADFEVFGQAVATSMGDLLGGTTGQILSKASNTDMDFTWTSANPGDITGVTAGVGISGGGTSGNVTVTNSMATAMTTSGDLIQATGSGTFARLGTGTAGQYLTTNGTTNSWGTISAGGETLLSTTTLSGTSTTISSISTSYKHLHVVLIGVYGSDQEDMSIRFNGDTGSFHQSGFSYGSTSSQSISGGSSAIISKNYNTSSTTFQTNLEMTIPRYSETSGFQIFSFNGWQGQTRNGIAGGGFYSNKSAAITSIAFLMSAGTFTAGTVYIYGVN